MIECGNSTHHRLHHTTSGGTHCLRANVRYPVWPRASGHGHVCSGAPGCPASRRCRLPGAACASAAGLTPLGAGARASASSPRAVSTSIAASPLCTAGGSTAGEAGLCATPAAPFHCTRLAGGGAAPAAEASAGRLTGLASGDAPAAAAAAKSAAPTSSGSARYGLRANWYSRSRTSIVRMSVSPAAAMARHMRCTCSTQGEKLHSMPSGRRHDAADAATFCGPGRSRNTACAAPCSDSGNPVASVSRTNTVTSSVSLF